MTVKSETEVQCCKISIADDNWFHGQFLMEAKLLFYTRIKKPEVFRSFYVHL